MNVLFDTNYNKNSKRKRKIRSFVKDDNINNDNKREDKIKHKKSDTSDLFSSFFYLLILYHQLKANVLNTIR
jgi:hypothetical protein